jgi:nitrogen fixation protein NifB
MTQLGVCTKRDISDHPCFYGSAKARWGRVHLPVAPHCNIQCNFCNRLYNCANESRPGITHGILKHDDIIPYLKLLFRRRSDISVVGIAGPGDPMCEPERTLEVLHAVHSEYPGLLLCLLTNGLNVSEYVDDLVGAGVTHLTVTVNAVDPEIGQLIYSWMRIKNVVYRGIEAATLLLARQKEAIQRLKDRDLMVKINTVIIPGVNTDHVEAIAQEVADLGADVMNCIPIIPVEDTPFVHLGAPTDEVMSRIRDFASLHMPQMYHCRRCRADAVGLLFNSETANHESDITCSAE